MSLSANSARAAGRESQTCATVAEHVDLTKDHAREVDRTRLAMEADKQDAPTAASASERARRRMRCSARLHDDIEPFAITDLKQQLSKIVACRLTT